MTGGIIMGGPGMPQTALQWMGPELARAGLIRHEDWVEAHVARAIALFPNQGMHVAASLLAALHPRAIEYLEQAPVLVQAATYGDKTSRKQDRAFIAMNFLPLIRDGKRLRAIMTTYRVAYPLRAVSRNAIRPGVWAVLQAITKHVDPSTIAQAIPADPKKHLYWLGDLANLWAVLERRAPDDAVRGRILAWAMPALSRAKPGSHPGAAAGLGEIADFMIAEVARFNPRWTWERVIQETRDWHEAIANAQIDNLNDGKYDHEVDYGMFPVEQSFGGYDFTALRSLRSLIIEGKAMHHCVSSYYKDIVSGQCRIYSIRKDGRRVATAEFVAFPAARAVQVKGVCNFAPPKDVMTAANAFAGCLNTARADDGVRMAAKRKGAA